MVLKIRYTVLPPWSLPTTSLTCGHLGSGVNSLNIILCHVFQPPCDVTSEVTSQPLCLLWDLLRSRTQMSRAEAEKSCCINVFIILEWQDWVWRALSVLGGCWHATHRLKQIKWYFESFNFVKTKLLDFTNYCPLPKQSSLLKANILFCTLLKWYF